MVRKFIVSQADFPYFRGGRPVLFFFLINSVGKFPGNHKQECRSVASYVRITMRSVIRTALGTASDDSCVRGGLHGYKATGHAREKPNLPICAYEIGDLEIIILV